MTAHWHHRLRLARRGLGYAAAIVLVLMALVAALVSQLLPLAERHPQEVAAWLSAQLGRPVAFDRLQTQWTRRGPLLRLDELRIGAGDKAIRIGDAEMLISQYAGLLPGHSFTELRLHGLELTLERGDDGRWRVRGLPGEQQAGRDPFAPLEGLGELQVIDGKLTLLAPRLQIRAQLPKVDLRLRVDGDRVRAGMRAWMQAGKSPLLATAEFSREHGNGKAWMQAERADLAAWSPVLHLAGVAAVAGHGRAEGWAQLRDGRVSEVVLDTALDDVRLQGAALADGSAPRQTLDRLQLRARWRARADGWRIDAPLLRLGSGARALNMDGLALAGGDRYAAVARRLDLGPLLAVAALSDRMTAGLRHWILAAKPQGRVADLRFTAVRGGRARVSARVDALGFDPVGNAPGLHGLAGTLQGDDAGFALALDSKPTVRFDWPAGFAVVHEAHLGGDIAGWREGAGWRLGTPALRVKAKDFGADVRGGMWFQGDGTRPWIDLAADLDATRVPVAKGFWIHYLMSKATTDWLDAALVDGRVEHARALVTGDLDDWPFRNGDGRFQASAHLADATLKFQPDWPAAEHVEGDVDFVADGFELRGKAVLAGVGIRSFQAGIERFGKARLEVQAHGGGDASKLLDLLRKSPLHARYGETLDNLQASGLASVDFNLDLPLHAGGGAAKTGGTVTLADVRMREQRWDLDIADMRGRAHYDGDGFVADALDVRYANHPGKLALRAGGHVRNQANGFEAELDADIGARELLAYAPQLAWLRPHANGRSSWSVRVAMPKQAAGSKPRPPAQLRLHSDMIGTALTLPAPMDKPAAAALPTSIEASLPLERGEVAIAFGQRLSLRARSDARGTGVSVVLGRDRVPGPPPPSGLVIDGHAGRLDAIDWAVLAAGSDTSGTGAASRNQANLATNASVTPAAGKPAGNAVATAPAAAGNAPGLSLRHVDVDVDHLCMLGADFPTTRLRAMPVAAGTLLQFDGDALTGTLLLPDAEGAAVAGRLQRVHWRPVASADPAPRTAPNTTAPAAAGNATAKQAAPAGDDVDPSSVPPLQLDIDDFRFGDARLGSAVVRTHPTTSGLRIDRLQTRAPAQRIDIGGDWSGVPGNTRTQLHIAIDSEDFGTLLDGLGYGGQLARGEGKATLDVGWAGSPAGFGFDTVRGSLALDLRDGQLTEVEPGAGRVLGLLSVAQLPRRLTLDFRDFFSKGFAFDELTGNVALAAGKARTTDLVIDGPAARIEIDGSADLHAQTFDQTILVLPKAGNLLAVVGAVAAGPVGAAIGAAASAVLKKPLGQLAAKTYHVSGPWKDPDVEVSEREPQRAQAAAKPPPG